MPRLLALFAAACALLALVWFALAEGPSPERIDRSPLTRTGTASPEQAPPSSADEPDTPSARERLAAPAQANSAETETATLAAPTRDLTIRGVVRDPAGTPIPNARVRALLDLGYGYQDWDIAESDRDRAVGREVDAAVTDAEGAFALNPGGLQVVTVCASSANRPERSVEGCVPGARLEIVLANGGTVEGSVTIADEAIPVADAEVRIFHGSEQDGFDIVRTDAAGRYRAVGLHPGSGGVLVVPREYAMARYAPFELEPGGTAQVDVEVVTGVRLAGRVTDAVTGNGVAGATVSPWGFIGQNALTDERGDFTIDGIRDGPGAGTLSVRADGYGRAEVRFEGPQNDLDVALRPGVAVRGRLVDAAGAPIEGARVVLAGYRREAGLERREWLRAASTDDGTFAFDSVRRDIDLALQARAPGFGATTRVLSSIGDGVNELDLGDLTLEAQATLAGRVLLGDGSPADGAGLTFRGPKGIDLPDDTAFHVGSVRVSADEDGAFFVSGLAAGAWTVWVNAPGGRSTEVDLTLAAGEDRSDVVLRLPGGGVLEGRVVDADDRGIEGAFVMVEANRTVEQTRLAAQCDVTGAFRIENVPEGTLRLGVSVPDDAMEGPEDPRFLSRVLEDVEADGAFLTVRLERLDGTASGVVVDARGDPVPLAYVCIPLGTATANSFASALADDAGRFELKVPSTGATRVLAWRTGPFRPDGNGNLRVAEWEVRRSIQDDEGAPVGEGTVRAGERDARIRIGGR